MKKVIVSAFLLLFSITMNAQANINKLPSTAKDFIQKNFQEVSVEEVKENSSWQIWEDEKYEVKLSNGIEIDFDENGNIIEIDSQREETIPVSALPSKITSYLQANYPNTQIKGWEKNNKKQEVELADGTELEFDAQGNFLKID